MSNRKRFAHMSIFHKFLAFVAVLVVAGSFVVIAVVTRAAQLEDGVEVEKNSLLTYYLHVKYDGVDVRGNQSGDTATAEVFSDRIDVTDVLPKGLTFEGFVTTADGKIGSVERGDSTKSCAGNVIDDTESDPFNAGVWEDASHFHYHGLHYDATTRTVSFSVRRLKAGCVLDVGIITRTPATVDDPETPNFVETRRDFYNTAIAREGDISARSNTVHVWMGSLLDPEEDQYFVSYHYTNTSETLPAGAPDVPPDVKYYKGATVLVDPTPTLDGYTFEGWKICPDTDDDFPDCDPTHLVPVSEEFIMPARQVDLYGTWTQSAAPTTYKVEYHIFGKDSDAEDLPSWVILDGGGRVVPKTRRYEEGETVAIDSTAAGKYDGYQFSGWLICPDDDANYPNCEVEDLVPVGIELICPETNANYPNCSEDDLTPVGVDYVMPDHDVDIYGYYDRVKYKVTYQFEGAIMPNLSPEDLAALLPAETEHYPGETITTAANPSTPGYRFLGWYKAASFKMPEEDVLILGEWGIENGKFSPKIYKQTLLPEQDHVYDTGDTFQFKIRLCNEDTLPIHDVIIQEQLEHAKFINGATLESDNSALETTLPAESIIKIASIPAAVDADTPSCAVLYSTYVVQETTSGTYTNTVEMIGALADNYNNLDMDQSEDYVASDIYVVEGNDPGPPNTGVVVRNTVVFIGLVVITVIGGSVVILNRKKS